MKRINQIVALLALGVFMSCNAQKTTNTTEEVKNTSTTEQKNILFIALIVIR